MVLTSFPFAAFFLFVLVVYWASESRKTFRKSFLFCCGLFFYGSINIFYLPLLLFVGISNYLFALWMARTDTQRLRQVLLAANITINIGQLAFFKYYDFFYRSAASLLLLADIQVPPPELQISLPVGISFFTFQALSYAIDVYRDPRQAVRSPLDVLLFVSFFPTILSGPIMRARDFIPQLNADTREPIRYQEGYALILSGLFKKIVISSYLSEHIVRDVFQVPADYSSLAVLAAVYSYSIQIYCDFSGYTDLALGMGILLGFKLPENFMAPYRAIGLIDFWRRWHISLSLWLRDYLYIPLGGNRKGVLRKYVNLMITMLLGGLWHGADLKFLSWGGLHGLGLVVTHLFKDLAARAGFNAEGHPGLLLPARILGWFCTFNLVSFLWVFFQAEDWNRAIEIIGSALSFGTSGKGFEFLVVPAILTGLGIQFLGKYSYDLYLKLQERLPVPLQAAVAAMLVIMILKLGPVGVPPFIYFSF